MNIPEDILSLLSAPQSAEALRRTEGIIRFLNSQDGRNLLSLLGGPGGAAFCDACRSSAGLPNPAKGLITGLAGTPEGSAVISQIFALAGRKGN